MENLITQKENLIFPSNKTLLPFQVEAVHKMLHFLRTNQCVYNACEMGLGKSVQSIVTINTLYYEYETPNVLIICPSVMKYTWQKEIEEWHTGVKWKSAKGDILVIEKPNDLKGLIANYTIISYGLISKLAPHLAEFDFDVLILDESHYLKNHKSLRSKAVFTHLWPAIKYKIALSGTPFTNNVVDGWSLFSRMSKEDFGDWWNFVNRYTNLKVTPWGQKPEGLKNAVHLSKIIREKFYIRYLKKDVLPQLPDKMHQMVYLPSSFSVKLTQKEKESMDTWVALVQKSFMHHMYKLPKPPISMMEKRRLQGIKKLPFVIEYIQEFLEQEIPVVVFGVHTEFIKQLAYLFKSRNPCVIIGSTTSADRQDAIERFQSGKSLLFIGNTQAAGVGITLTASSNVILAEFDFIPSIISQAIARCHRIGQKDTVNVHYLVVKDSMEEDILNVVIKKQNDFNKVLDSNIS